MWYLRWERGRVTRIHCYIFSQIFLLTTFFTGTHKDKAIDLQQGKSLTQNKDSILKTEWASKGTQKHDQNCNDQNAWIRLCTALLVVTPDTSSFTALRGDHPKSDFQEDDKRFALFTQEVFVSQLSCEHWWENTYLAALCWKQLQSVSNSTSPWWSG